MAASRVAIKLGILAEDASDVDVLSILLSKIDPKRVFSVRKFIGHGCGKLRHKCQSWAEQLAREGCGVVILLHDRDREDVQQLRATLEANFLPCPVKKHLIVIPVEELEAWLLSDQKALRAAFNLKKEPKCPNNPETVKSPKEKLAELIWRASGKNKRYINTIHNSRIAAHLQISTLRKCAAFRPLEGFWKGLTN